MKLFGIRRSTHLGLPRSRPLCELAITGAQENVAVEVGMPDVGVPLVDEQDIRRLSLYEARPVRTKLTKRAMRDLRQYGATAQTLPK